MDRPADRIPSDSLRFERVMELERFDSIEVDETRGAEVARSGDRVGLIKEDDERDVVVVELVERLGADE